MLVAAVAVVVATVLVEPGAEEAQQVTATVAELLETLAELAECLPGQWPSWIVDPAKLQQQLGLDARSHGDCCCSSRAAW